MTLTGGWRPCVGCSKAKARRFAILKTTNERADEPLGQVLRDFVGAMKPPSVVGKHFVRIFVNGYSRMKWTGFLQKKSNTGEGLMNYYRWRGYTSESQDWDD